MGDCPPNDEGDDGASAHALGAKDDGSCGGYACGADADAFDDETDSTDTCAVDAGDGGDGGLDDAGIGADLAGGLDDLDTGIRNLRWLCWHRRRFRMCQQGATSPGPGGERACLYRTTLRIMAGPFWGPAFSCEGARGSGLWLP